ncbi:MAG: hypothetical protein V1726_05295 [Methanobacteriota archaeon]
MRKILTIGSIVAVIILVLTTYPSIVSAQTIKSENTKQEKLPTILHLLRTKSTVQFGEGISLIILAIKFAIFFIISLFYSTLGAIDLFTSLTNAGVLGALFIILVTPPLWLLIFVEAFLNALFGLAFSEGSGYYYP